MLTILDHLVILVGELEEAVAGNENEKLGFRVTPVGERYEGVAGQPVGLLADGAFLELVAFVYPNDERDNVWSWKPFLGTGGGLVDYGAAPDDLAADVRRLAEAGFGLEGPNAGGRTLPDGMEIR